MSSREIVIPVIQGGGIARSLIRTSPDDGDDRKLAREARPMTIQHHLDPATLMSCAAGAQPEALAAVIVSHLAVCPCCRAELKTLDLMARVAFDAIPPVAMSQASEARALAMLATNGPLGTPTDMSAPSIPGRADNRAAREWRNLAAGVTQSTVELSPSAQGALHLLRLMPGAVLTTPTGVDRSALMIVVDGCCVTSNATYRVGDVADMDDMDIGALVADAQLGCTVMMGSDHASALPTASASVASARSRLVGA
jgi:putative transcriptional regulator